MNRIIQNNKFYKARANKSVNRYTERYLNEIIKYNKNNNEYFKERKFQRRQKYFNMN